MAGDPKMYYDYRQNPDNTFEIMNLRSVVQHMDKRITELERQIHALTNEEAAE